MNKLKIGIFMDSFYPAVDGVVLVVDNLAKELCKFADVTVVVPKNEIIEDDKKRPYKVVRINSMHVPTTEYRVGIPFLEKTAINRELWNERFDIIHIHSPFSIGKLGIEIAKKQNIPVIATMHTRFDFEIRRYLKSEQIVNLAIKKIIKVFNKCDKCIAVNKAMTSVFKEYGYKGTPIVEYNGTDMKMIDNPEKAESIINEKFNINNNENVLLFVGRINRVKNIFFILDVLEKLKDKDFKFKMIFVGTGPDEDELKKRIKEKKLINEVILTGKIMDRELLKSIYYRANLFVFPSLFDASSLVQIEAASQGTPTIFIEGSVTSDTITNNENGYTEKEDVGLFSDRIIQILEDKENYDRICKNAKEQLSKPWEEIAKETYQIYLSEIERKKNK